MQHKPKRVPICMRRYRGPWRLNTGLPHDVSTFANGIAGSQQDPDFLSLRYLQQVPSSETPEAELATAHGEATAE